MATLHLTTTSSGVAVTNEEAVRDLLYRYNVEPRQWTVEDGLLTLHGRSGFNAYPDETGIPRTEEFLHELREFIDSELVIQTVGTEKCRHPVVAYQYRVTPEGVYYSDLGEDEYEVVVGE